MEPITAACALDDAPGRRSLQPFVRQAVAVHDHQREFPLPRLNPRRLFRLFTGGAVAGASHLRVAARLLNDAAEMSLDIVVCRWSDDYLRGLYIDELALVALNADLSPYQVIGTLSHELVHAAYRDSASTVWTEARADMMGAHRIVDLPGIRAVRSDRTDENNAPTGPAGAVDRVRRSVGMEAEHQVDWGNSIPTTGIRT